MLAFYDVKHAGATNRHRDDPALHYGLDLDTFLKVIAITGRAARTAELIYRQRRRNMRATDPISAGASCFPKRWNAKAMHTAFFRERLERKVTGDIAATAEDPQDRRLLDDWIAGSTVGELIQRAFAAVSEKRVLPSMRSLQFGGDAILRNHARLFNCSFSMADRLEFFREYYFLLLAGTGCGFSVQRHHVGRLPALPRRGEEIALPVVHRAVADTIEGWADALHVLLLSYVEEFKVELNFSAVRPRGQALVTSVGKAPGHLPLKQTLNDVDAVLRGASGRRLRPLEVYEICMFVARSVRGLAAAGRRLGHSPASRATLFPPRASEPTRFRVSTFPTREPAHDRGFGRSTRHRRRHHVSRRSAGQRCRHLAPRAANVRVPSATRTRINFGGNSESAPAG